MKKTLALVFALMLALTFMACGDDDDDGGGNGNNASTEVTCSDGTKVKISEYPNCVKYLEELGKCCPKAEEYYLQAAEAVVCQGEGTDDSCKAIVDNDMAMNAACDQLKQIPQCQ